jgi:hypothetical protein
MTTILTIAALWLALSVALGTALGNVLHDLDRGEW